MKALITGVNGFVGEYLAEYLVSQGIEVWGTKLKGKKLEETLEGLIIVRDLDITDEKAINLLLEEYRPDYIFNLAAQSSVAVSWKKPQVTMNVNLIGTINLLEAVRRVNLDIKILLIGSSEEYGIIRPENIPISENCNINPSNPYAVSKAAQEQIAKQYVKVYGMNIIIVRAFNHIGPKQSPIFVVSDFAKRIAEMEKGLIESTLLVGNLQAKRDFTDVRDIVRGYYELITKGINGEVYNIGSGNCYKIEDILNALLKMSKLKIEVKQDFSRMRPSDIPIIQCDNTKISQSLGWRPQYKIEDTLVDVLNYWRNIT